MKEVRACSSGLAKPEMSKIWSLPSVMIDCASDIFLENSVTLDPQPLVRIEAA